MIELVGSSCKDCIIFSDSIDSNALSIIYGFINHPMFADTRIRIMPDVHEGKDIVVGFTAPFHHMSILIILEVTLDVLSALSLQTYRPIRNIILTLKTYSRNCKVRPWLSGQLTLPYQGVLRSYQAASFRGSESVAGICIRYRSWRK